MTFGKRADPPEAPFDFGLQERISFEPMPSVSTASDFASPADTVVPWRDNLERMKRFAPLLAVILVGVIGGAVLGLRDRTPQLVANPASIPVAKPAASAPPPKAEPPPAPVVAPPCVEAPAAAKPAALPVSVEPRRTSDSDERRARRHHERRLRRRAAQCAAGRVEKCDPV